MHYIQTAPTIDIRSERTAIEVELQALLSPSVEGDCGEVQEAMRYAVLGGGKRIRPNRVLLVGKMLGGNPEVLVTLGAAVELLHTATLVHDDLIDGALLRRDHRRRLCHPQVRLGWPTDLVCPLHLAWWGIPLALQWQCPPHRTIRWSRRWLSSALP